MRLWRKEIMFQCNKLALSDRFREILWKNDILLYDLTGNGNEGSFAIYKSQVK